MVLRFTGKMWNVTPSQVTDPQKNQSRGSWKEKGQFWFLWSTLNLIWTVKQTQNSEKFNNVIYSAAQYLVHEKRILVHLDLIVLLLGKNELWEHSGIVKRSRTGKGTRSYRFKEYLLLYVHIGWFSSSHLIFQRSVPMQDVACSICSNKVTSVG